MADLFLPLGQATRYWNEMASASNGDIYAIENGGDVYRRINGAGDFLPLHVSVGTSSWCAITVDKNDYIYIADYNGDIYISTNNGASFSALNQTNRQWSGLTSASNGDIYACEINGDIYKRTNGLGNFVSLSQGTKFWSGITAAPNGDIYASNLTEDLYIQIGGTGSFLPLSQQALLWFAMAAAPSGDIYAVVNNGDIYKRTGGTGNFIAMGQTSRNWKGITVSTAGDIYANEENGDIYEYAFPVALQPAIILSQRTNRHVVKKLDSSYVYANAFGNIANFGMDNDPTSNPIDNISLKFPAGITADSAGNVYVCDSKNSRIVKLDSNLAFINALDVSSTLGKPYAILFDSTTSDLYVAGIYINYQVSIARITTTLVVSKSGRNIYQDAKDRLYGISRGFGANEFLVVVGNKILTLTEEVGSSFIATSVGLDTIQTTAEDAEISRTDFVLSNKLIVPLSNVFYRTWTETPTGSGVNFQTTRFPVIGTPNIDFKVFVNNVQYDYDISLATPNDYSINQTTGAITLGQALLITDKIKIRYKFLMTDMTDYVLNQSSGALTLSRPITNIDTLTENNVHLADGFTTDKLVLNYNYLGVATSLTIQGEENTFFTGIVKHSTTNTIFVAGVKDNTGKIMNVNSSYKNIGDSDKISKSIVCLTEAPDGTLLTYDNSKQKIVRFDSNLNKVEDVYIDTTDFIATDAYDICGIAQF